MMADRMPHEHDPTKHPCFYRGWSMWSCGHIDGMDYGERCDCGCCTGSHTADVLPEFAEASA